MRRCNDCADLDGDTCTCPRRKWRELKLEAIRTGVSAQPARGCCGYRRVGGAAKGKPRRSRSRTRNGEAIGPQEPQGQRRASARNAMIQALVRCAVWVEWKA